MTMASATELNSHSRILVVDDEPGMRKYLGTLLELEGYDVEMADSGEQAIERFQHGAQPDLVLLDMMMPGIDGLQTIEQLRKIRSDLKVIMLSCVSDTRKVVQAVRMGAYDYLHKPFKKAELDALVRTCLQSSTPVESRAIDETQDTEEFTHLSDDISFIVRSPEMRRLREQAVVVAKYDVPILLLGESGTGKEVLALFLHRFSTRSNRPFMKVNCAAVPSELLESELFGYEAGAFTGATKAKPGKFEQCDGGTLLLDEIGEMPAALQAKMLHVLQDGQFSRLGSRSMTTKVDVRILAATNVDIPQAIAAKQLRQDLYYRLNGFSLHLPPLRERREEIPVLLKHFIAQYADRFARPVPEARPGLLQACIRYPWPGNLRELENFAKRFVILGDEKAALADLQASDGAAADSQQDTGLKSLARSVKNVAEAEAIARALQQTGWHRQKAAVILQISYKALLYKIRQYGLQPPPRATGIANAARVG
jgi:DNA-binding NtrC family response regulator